MRRSRHAANNGVVLEQGKKRLPFERRVAREKFARDESGQASSRLLDQTRLENDSDLTQEDRQRIFARVKGSVLRIFLSWRRRVRGDPE